MLDNKKSQTRIGLEAKKLGPTNLIIEEMHNFLVSAATINFGSNILQQ
jgi:hypothetical protein